MPEKLCVLTYDWRKVGRTYIDAHMLRPGALWRNVFLIIIRCVKRGGTMASSPRRWEAGCGIAGCSDGGELCSPSLDNDSVAPEY